MLVKFEVSNYKNFKDKIVVDFSSVGGYQFNSDCITDGVISKMLIYGKNATGKTNLGHALMDIAKRSSLYRLNRTSFLNADSDSNVAEFSYSFQFAQNHVQYLYHKLSSYMYAYEELKINNVSVFSFDYIRKKFTVSRLDLIDADTLNYSLFVEKKSNSDLMIEDNFGTPTFLRWLFANAVFDADSVMTELRNYISSMMLYSASDNRRSFNDKIYTDIFEGELLKEFEQFLNAMGIECELVNRRLPNEENELYFKHKTLLPFFETASSGTISLYNFYRRIVMRMKNLSFFYLDEFDAFFHYEMSERFLNYVKEYYPRCQVILSTHNTNLMTNRLMRPDCVFILSQEGKLTALNKATTRELREGHNLEKLYMSGEFDG